jgi:hypothetical protein
MRVLIVAVIFSVLCGASAPSGPHTDAGMVSRTKAPQLGAGGAWEWAAAAPGANIYVSYHYAPRAGSIATVWVDREYFRNLAGLNKSFIELMQFDCDRMAARPLSTPADSDALSRGDHAVTVDLSFAWEQVRSGTVSERVATAVCGRKSPQSAKPRDTYY